MRSDNGRPRNFCLREVQEIPSRIPRTDNRWRLLASEAELASGTYTTWLAGRDQPVSTRLPLAKSAYCRIARGYLFSFRHQRPRVMRCDYSGGRSMGSTRVGDGDDTVTRLGWSALSQMCPLFSLSRVPCRMEGLRMG
jgi:hypothetical protein